jgi:hypothetical protein
MITDQLIMTLANHLLLSYIRCPSSYATKQESFRKPSLMLLIDPSNLVNDGLEKTALNRNKLEVETKIPFRMVFPYYPSTMSKYLMDLIEDDLKNHFIHDSSIDDSLTLITQNDRGYSSCHTMLISYRVLSSIDHKKEKVVHVESLDFDRSST